MWKGNTIQQIFSPGLGSWCGRRQEGFLPVTAAIQVVTCMRTFLIRWMRQGPGCLLPFLRTLLLQRGASNEHAECSLYLTREALPAAAIAATVADGGG